MVKRFNKLSAINVRLLTEIAASGVLAFIIVSVVFSATSPAPMSLAYMMPLV